MIATHGVATVPCPLGKILDAWPQSLIDISEH